MVFGHGAGRSPCAHSIGKFFLCYILFFLLKLPPPARLGTTCIIFSRMRSEGFPFIVGVWVWACVRVVLLCRRRLVVVSSSCRRRLVVVASLIRCHWAVHSHCDTHLTFKVWKVEEVSHEMLFLALPSHKMWGCFRVLRDGRNTLEACQCKRVVFSWQAQHYVMWPFAMSWQAQHFVTSRRCYFHKSHWQGRANVTLFQISWQAQQFVSVLKSGGSFAKVILFELWKSSIFKLKVWNLKEVSHEMLVLALQTFKVRGHFRVLRGRRKTLEAPCLKSWGSIARNARFGSFCFEKLRKPRTKCSSWKLLHWKVAEASHEMLVLETCSLKSWGSLARNARFGSLFLEKLRKPRTKCSFWKLVPWKVEEASHEMLVLEACWKIEEASHEMLVLEACSLKSWGSLARNARFGSLFLEKLRKHRTKCSFWKLVPWKVEEASHQILVLEACSLESWGSLARNVRFGSFCSTLYYEVVLE